MRRSRATTGSGARRIISITSSMLATAMARPTSTWARSRACLSSYLARRVMTSARKRMKASRSSLRLIGHGLALELDHQPHAVAIAFVANLGDTLDPLVAHHLGDALVQARLVLLIG